MGDAEADAETALLQSKQPIDADILVAGHHGGSTSSIQAFLDAVNPKTVVIPVGEDNPYGHPHREALSRLQSAAPVLRTDLDETVVCLTDGNTSKISPHRTATVIESAAAGRAA
jgi:beta-lactamase superfamily II metal-dependent hydrolase